jgi:hypothetical protein
LEEIKVQVNDGAGAVAGEPEVGPVGEKVGEPGELGAPGELVAGEIKAETPPICDLCKGKQKLECPVCKSKPNPKCPACNGTKEISCPACVEPEVKQPTLIIQFKSAESIQFSIEAAGFHPGVMNLQMMAVAEFLKVRVNYILNKQFEMQEEELKVKSGIQSELLRGVKPGMRVPPVRR